MWGFFLEPPKNQVSFDDGTTLSHKHDKLACSQTNQLALASLAYSELDFKKS